MARESQKLSGPGKRRATPGKGQNIWDREQREVVHILYTRFQISIPEKVKVFNEIFKTHLSACGLPDGLQPGPFTSQYGERHKTWPIDICQRATSPEEVARRQTIYERIVRAGVSIHSDLGTRTSLPAQQALTPALEPARSHTPSMRLRAVSRIRSFAYQNIDDGNPGPSKKRKIASSKAVVVICQKERDDAIAALKADNAAVVRTSVKSPRSSSSRRADATVRYDLPSGTTIWLTPEQFRQTQADLIPIPNETAHPYVPLLFRYWTDQCLSPLTDKGFQAGRFSSTIIPPPPPPSLNSFPWSCAHQHLNRDPKVASPFISTSNNFVWIIRLALKEMKRGAQGGCISLINPTTLDRRSIFHAQPIHRELCKKRPFDNAAFMYHGMNEFLVWANIPREAVVSTFPVQMLLNLASTNASIGAILRLEQLVTPRTGYFTKLLPSFKQDNITLCKASINAMARMCHALGLNATMVEAISSVVSDVIKGYGITLQFKSKLQWQEVASIFGQAMCPPDSNLSTMQNMKYAFVDACRWATGDFNARQKPKHMKTMLGRAAKIGLDSPDEIVTSELDAAKLSIAAFEKKQQALLRGGPSRALLAEPDEDDQIIPHLIEDEAHDLNDSDNNNNNHDFTRRRLFVQDEDIVYDLEDEENRSIYEL